jgi:hypothetical protein
MGCSWTDPGIQSNPHDESDQSVLLVRGWVSFGPGRGRKQYGSNSNGPIRLINITEYAFDSLSSLADVPSWL